jgi:hypothetical protein
VTFIKRECDRHPGCYTMTDKCEVCATEDFRAAVAEIWQRFAEETGRILAAVSGGETTAMSSAVNTSHLPRLPEQEGR